MQLLKAARFSVLPDWKWRIVPNAQNNRIWRIIIVHLATLRGRSTNDSSLYSQSRYPFQNFVKDPEKHKYPTRQNPGLFWNPCRTHFLGLKKRICPGKRGLQVTLGTMISDE